MDDFLAFILNSPNLDHPFRDIQWLVISTLSVGFWYPVSTTIMEKVPHSFMFPVAFFQIWYLTARVVKRVLGW